VELKFLLDEDYTHVFSKIKVIPGVEGRRLTVAVLAQCVLA